MVFCYRLLLSAFGLLLSAEKHVVMCNSYTLQHFEIAHKYLYWYKQFFQSKIRQFSEMVHINNNPPY